MDVDAILRKPVPVTWSDTCNRFTVDTRRMLADEVESALAANDVADAYDRVRYATQMCAVRLAVIEAFSHGIDFARRHPGRRQRLAPVVEHGDGTVVRQLAELSADLAAAESLPVRPTPSGIEAIHERNDI